VASLKCRKDGDNGVPSPGDTLRFEGVVANEGLVASGSVSLSVPLDAGASLVGSWSSAGTVGVADEVWSVSPGAVSPGVPLVFGYDVEVGFLAALNEALVYQGAWSETGGPGGVTDSPHTTAVGDATEVPVSTTPYPERTGYAGPYPTVSLLAPTAGSRVATPVWVEATVAPTEGASLVWWEVELEGREQQWTLGQGEGAPPSTSLALLDPTVLANGVYTLRVVAIDSAGLMGWDEGAVEVGGDFKPGSMSVSFVDGEYALPSGGSLKLVRSYDTLRRGERGDFGYGWRLDVLDVRVAANGPLGEGWGQTGCGAGYLYGTVCFVAQRPHVVALAWPDGSQESWEYQPAPSSSYMGGVVASPGFVPRAGTTSGLSISGMGWYVDGDIYRGLGSEGVLSPSRYTVTRSDGSVWVVDTDDGLVSVAWSDGSTLAVTPTGLDLEPGADLVWTRDGNGRIEALTFPDATTVSYAYTSSGDLEVVTDQLGDEVTFSYAGAHQLTSWAGEGRPPAATWTYDAEGRVVSVEDGEGVGTALAAFDLEDFTVTLVGPDPGLTTVETYDLDGNLAEVAQNFGGESYVTA
jgi:hypothetical protein